MIKIIDDIFEEQFLDYLNHTFKYLHYKFYLDHNNVFEEHHNETPLMLSNSGPEQFDSPPYEYMFKTFLEADKSIDKNITVNDRYIHLSPYGATGPLHHDTHIQNDLSFLFYPSIWDPKYEGSTLIRPDEGDDQIIEYKQNRLVIFDGSFWHQAMHHTNPNHRFTVVFLTHFITRQNYEGTYPQYDIVD